MVKKVAGFLIRFTIVHVITYAVAGILLFTLQNYEEAFAVQEHFALYRPLDDPLVMAAIPLQILRGAFLALLFYPFYGAFIRHGRGWLWFFLLTFTLIAAGSPGFVPGVIDDIVTGKPLAQFLVGPLEIVVQILMFSLLLYLWEQRVLRQTAVATPPG